MNLIALICTVVSYLLFFIFDLTVLPFAILIVGAVIGAIDLIQFYGKEKPIFEDFVKDAFREHFGSSISVVAILGLIIIAIFY